MNGHKKGKKSAYERWYGKPYKKRDERMTFCKDCGKKPRNKNRRKTDYCQPCALKHVKEHKKYSFSVSFYRRKM